MHSTGKQTAILVFSHTAKEELLHKPFSKNTQLFYALNSEILQKVRRSGLPYFHFTEQEQVGDTFGERFVNAIQQVYDQGYDSIITVGNDSPQLQTAHLLKAKQQLDLGKTVLGPTYDGGFYLMGLQRSKFDFQHFLYLPWQQFRLFHKISELLETKDTDIYQLPVLQDIDKVIDATSLLNFTKSISKVLLQALAALFLKLQRYVLEHYHFYRYLFYTLFFNKGSPTAQLQ